MTQPPDQTQPVSPVPPTGPPPPPPAAAPAAAPAATPAAAAPMAGQQTTPLPPAPATPPPGVAGHPATHQPADRATLISAGLGVLVLGLTVLALAVEENQQRGYSEWTTWAVFATIMAAAHLLPLVWRTEPRRVWDVVAVATGGLVFYWVALVLPFIGNATSFAQTLAVALALAHLWLLPGKR